MRLRPAALFGFSAFALSACVPQTGGEPIAEAPPTEVVQPVRAASVSAPAPAPTPRPAPTPSRKAVFAFDGRLEQGGWLRGQAPGGAVSARLDDTPLALDDEGRFFAGLDRDAEPTATLRATLADGRVIASPVKVAPRNWNIERVNVARNAGKPSEAFMQRHRPELEAIYAARANETHSAGWRQDFVWPVTGRISGRLGWQRIFRGEPAATTRASTSRAGRAPPMSPRRMAW